MKKHIVTGALVVTSLLPGQKAQGQKVTPDPQSQSAPATDTPPALPSLLDLPQPPMFQLPPPAAETQTVQPSLDIPPPSPPPLFPIKESDLKFNLDGMVSKLEDARHESMVLTAYPDWVTKDPIIGPGVTLRFSKKPPRTDLPEPFAIGDARHIEPDPVELCMAAGLKKEDVDAILARFDQRMKMLHADRLKASDLGKKFQARIKSGEFAPDISEEKARSLGRFAAFQAAYNGRFYAPMAYDKMTPSQQEGMAHIIYQWGPHAMGLKRFIAALNDPANLTASGELSPQFGHNVQQALIHEPKYFSKYHTRAAAVTAMFDPAYQDDPQLAEKRVRAMAGEVPRGRHVALVAQTRQAGKHHAQHPSHGGTQRE